MTLSVKPAPASSTLLEQHFTSRQLATRWGLSARFVRELFRTEPDVIQIDRPEEMHKRSYTTMRIPESAAARVHARLACRSPRR